MITTIAILLALTLAAVVVLRAIVAGNAADAERDASWD